MAVVKRIGLNIVSLKLSLGSQFSNSMKFGTNSNFFWVESRKGDYSGGQYAFSKCDNSDI